TQVREAIVLAQDGASGPQLVAYVVPAAQVAADTPEAQAQLREQLKAALKEVLPDYMLPAHLLFLEALPLSPNGKLDRKALPKADASQLQQAYNAPQSELEQQVAALWSQVLGVDQVGLDDNFFELGGHSLDALRLIGAINQALAVQLSINALFTAPTVGQLAGVIAAGQADSAQNVIALGGSGQPLFCFHPAGGSVYGYLPLAAQLRDRCAVYGVLHQAYLQADWSEVSWLAMIERYVASIRQVQPSGPYYLAGWSLGGSIAMDVASELEAAGETVRFLGLLDPTPPQGTGDDLVQRQEAPVTVTAESEWRAIIDKLCQQFPGSAGMIESRLTREAELDWQSIHGWVAGNIPLAPGELDRVVGLFKAEFDASLVSAVFNDLSALSAAYAYRPLRVAPRLWWSSDYTPEQIQVLEQAMGCEVQGGEIAASRHIEVRHEAMVDSTALLESFREQLSICLN
ncbi:thioesterase domain-containing protein, partial [Pseudomonas sp. 910_21]